MFFHWWRLPLSFHSFLSAGAVKRTTLVKSTSSDNNNSNSMLPMLDLTLNDLSLLSGWLGWTPSQEFILCEELRPVLFLCSPFAMRYCSSSKEQLEWNLLDTALLSCHLNEFPMSYLQKITVAPSFKQISSKFSHLHISRMSLLGQCYLMTENMGKYWTFILIKHHCAFTSIRCCRDAAGRAHEDTFTPY